MTKLVMGRCFLIASIDKDNPKIKKGYPILSVLKTKVWSLIVFQGALDLQKTPDETMK